MNPGKLDTRIEIGEYKNIKDPKTFLPIKTWFKKYSVYSQKLNRISISSNNEPLPRTEYTISFKIRKKDDVEGLIVKYKGSDYQILYAEESPRLEHFIILRCKDVK